MKIRKKFSKVEIWKVDGITFVSCKDALDYCIKNKYVITDEKTIFTKTGLAHLWNITKIK